MRIVDLDARNERAINEAAALLFDGFREHWPNAWPTPADALREVRETTVPDNINRVAIGDDESLMGWIGGISTYGGWVWELHPLVVKEDERRQGIGRALVADLEERVAERGGVTLWVGTDDEDGMTILSGADLYQGTFQKLQRIGNLKGHPYESYQKCGFVITGVVPDANGPGKPDILMAKRVQPPR